MQPQEYDRKWRQKFWEIGRECIRTPPPVPTHSLTPSLVDSHLRKLREFHDIWGSWWMWLLCMPFLCFMILLRRLIQHILLIFTLISVWKMYGRISFLRILLVPLATVFHLMERYLFLLWLLPKDLISLFRREAFWRDPSCFSTIMNVDKRIVSLNLAVVIFWKEYRFPIYFFGETSCQRKDKIHLLALHT